ncbi:PepSY domain-containing protein [Shewanella sp.]|uniref:PepSY domain-containing protein n=1 Tax=Shewanella sp. TaxID=50422 RepID=UPI003564EE72
MKYRFLLTILLGASLQLAQPTAALAQMNNQGQQQALRVTSGDQAAGMAASRYPGRVLKVSRSQVGGNPGYRIKMVSDDGKVFYVSVDARTGRVGRD